MIGNLIAWLILGLIAGAIAKAIYPGHQGGGILATIGLGILGALLGGWLGLQILGTGAGATAGALSIPSILFAIIGAMILIFIWGLLTRRSA
ncbi:MAG: GlsB/YeaQ/YmgE family stress response membrane protein [Coleofasciculus sp. Co-bin14]|nr:GlsB/YeaQ/YmgE family stress response membrane protein [Coleofasciculus sp. Co-bin14]